MKEYEVLKLFLNSEVGEVNYISESQLIDLVDDFVLTLINQPKNTIYWFFNSFSSYQINYEEMFYKLSILNKKNKENEIFLKLAIIENKSIDKEIISLDDAARYAISLWCASLYFINVSITDYVIDRININNKNINIEAN
jgi:hypothetical protein